MKSLKNAIRESIEETTVSSLPPFYQKPLVGYATASDPIFTELKTLSKGLHLLPTDLLVDAQSVVAFFLPYTEDIIISNKGGSTASRKWAEAYHHTNSLIDNICRGLNNLLNQRDINSAWLLPTYEFDKERLVAAWSHKHVAYACGLGTFGANQLLITARGCAGRFGTFVMSAEVEPSTTRPVKTHHCLGKQGCHYCIERCPVGALSASGLDSQLCYAHCLTNDQLFPDLTCVEVCGKCSTGPCSGSNPKP